MKKRLDTLCLLSRIFQNLPVFDKEGFKVGLLINPALGPIQVLFKQPKSVGQAFENGWIPTHETRVQVSPLRIQKPSGNAPIRGLKPSMEIRTT